MYFISLKLSGIKANKLVHNFTHTRRLSMPSYFVNGKNVNKIFESGSQISRNREGLRMHEMLLNMIQQTSIADIIYH